MGADFAALLSRVYWQKTFSIALKARVLRLNMRMTGHFADWCVAQFTTCSIRAHLKASLATYRYIWRQFLDLGMAAIVQMNEILNLPKRLFSDMRNRPRLLDAEQHHARLDEDQGQRPGIDARSRCKNCENEPRGHCSPGCREYWQDKEKEKS